MTCSNHCLCNRDCRSHRGACPSNSYSFSSDSIVRANHINQLRTAVNQERSRRFLGAYGFGSSVSTYTTISGSHFNAIKGAINQMAYLVGDSYSGNIMSSHISNLRSAINKLRVDCVCNTNCDAHSACSCHGNCGCNYSDANLKENIEYL